MRFLFFSILFLLISNNFYAQDFGEEYEDFLSIKTFTQEADADILVIFDKCEVEITRDFNLELKRHARIKILTEEGKEYANVKISYWHEDNIYNLDAASYSPNGEVHEIESDNIFDEGNDKHKIKSLAIPGVEIGSVIEFEYDLYSKYITGIEPWFFQNKNYTLHSEYKLQIPPGFTFNKVELNMSPEFFTVKEELIREPNYPKENSKLITWSGKNLPGIKDEPYVDCLQDQYAQLLIIFNAYDYGFQHYTFAKTWNHIAERLNEGYSDFLDDEIDLPKDLEEIVNSKSDIETKTKEIYSYISNEIKTGSHSGIYAPSFRDLEDILENKLGSATEKNILLINLYRRLGLNANPVLISTRSNGAIIPNFVSPSQFNRIICSVELNNKKYFVYTGSKYIPFGYLIISYNVSAGFEITGETGKIIKLSPRQFQSKTNIETKGKLTEEGILNLVSTIIHTGYPAYNARVNMEDEDLFEWISSKVGNLYETAEVDTFFVEDSSINDPLKLTIHYSIPEYVEESDNLIYFTPPLFSNFTENVFVRENRAFPINFSYKKNIYEKCKIELPKNVTISDQPGKKKMNIKNYTYAKMYSRADNYIQVLMMRNRKARTFKSAEYKKLRIFFEKMLEYDTEQLVLVKTSTSVDK